MGQRDRLLHTILLAEYPCVENRCRYMGVTHCPMLNYLLISLFTDRWGLKFKILYESRCMHRQINFWEMYNEFKTYD